MNTQWYKCFNTCYEVVKSVGVHFDCFEVLWEYCAGLLNNSVGMEYKNLSSDDQLKAKSNAKEHLLAYIFFPKQCKST